MPKITTTIDWISATSHKEQSHLHHTAHPSLHDWENWANVNGINGYTIGAKHECGAKVYLNLERADMGKHIIYSGKTLSRIKKMYDIEKLDVLDHHISNGHNISRLDIALDFYGSTPTVQEFQDAYMNGFVQTKLRSATVIKDLTGNGHTFYLGSRKARKKLVRVYDKSAEQGWDFPCTRVEVQLMGKPATTAGIAITRAVDKSCIMIACMRDVADFESVYEWNKAMVEAGAVKLGTEYEGAGDTRRWLEETVKLCLAREAVLDWTWWVQYKLELGMLIEDVRNKNVDDIPF